MKKLTDYIAAAAAMTVVAAAFVSGGCSDRSANIKAGDEELTAVTANSGILSLEAENRRLRRDCERLRADSALSGMMLRRVDAVMSELSADIFDASLAMSIAGSRPGVKADTLAASKLREASLCIGRMRSAIGEQ